MNWHPAFASDVLELQGSGADPGMETLHLRATWVDEINKFGIVRVVQNVGGLRAASEIFRERREDGSEYFNPRQAFARILGWNIDVGLLAGGFYHEGRSLIVINAGQSGWGDTVHSVRNWLYPFYRAAHIMEINLSRLEPDHPTAKILSSRLLNEQTAD